MISLRSTAPWPKDPRCPPPPPPKDSRKEALGVDPLTMALWRNNG